MKKIILLGSSQGKSIAQILSQEYDASFIQNENTQRGILKKLVTYIRNIKDADVIYNVFTDEKFYLKAFIAKIMGKKVLTHWIGTDVWNLLQNKKKYRCLSIIDKHLCCSLPLKNELASKGINADYLPIIPIHVELSTVPMPEKHAVLIYIPEGREDFYGYNIIKEVITYYSDVQFYIVANSNTTLFPQNNVVLMGFVDSETMELLYSKISIVLRVPIHDGLSMSIIEGLAKGKQVIYSYTHPYTFLARNFEEACAGLDQILASKPSVNYEGSYYVNENYTTEKYLKRFNNIIKGVLN